MFEESAPKKRTRKKPAKKGEMDKAERGDVLILIGKVKKAAAKDGVHVWHLQGEEKTEGGDRYAVAHISTSAMYDLGWIRRK